MKKPVPAESTSALIDEKIRELGDWRGQTLTKLRKIIHEADPEIVEGWKWRGTPVWSHGGIVCTGETYKNHVKMTFANGAALKDPSALFNASLEGELECTSSRKHARLGNARPTVSTDSRRFEWSIFEPISPAIVRLAGAFFFRLTSPLPPLLGSRLVI